MFELFKKNQKVTENDEGESASCLERHFEALRVQGMLNIHREDGVNSSAACLGWTCAYLVD